MLKAIEQRAHKAGTVYESRHRKSVTATHINAILAWGRLRKGESITRDDVSIVYKQLKSQQGITRGFKSGNSLLEDQLYSIKDLQQDHGLMVNTIWHEALTGIPAEARAYYLSILRQGRKLTAQPQVIINTIHGVKGGEADNVLVLCDMAYKTFAEYEVNPDDEHRVFYVAASRAKKILYLAAPTSQYFYDW